MKKKPDLTREEFDRLVDKQNAREITYEEAVTLLMYLGWDELSARNTLALEHGVGGDDVTIAD